MAGLAPPLLLALFGVLTRSAIVSILMTSFLWAVIVLVVLSEAVRGPHLAESAAPVAKLKMKSFAQEPRHLEQERFAAQRGDLGRDLVDFVRHARDIRENARALLQVQRPEPLQIAPHRDAFAGRLGRHPINQHPPAQRHAAFGIAAAPLTSRRHVRTKVTCVVLQVYPKPDREFDTAWFLQGTGLRN